MSVEREKRIVFFVLIIIHGIDIDIMGLGLSARGVLPPSLALSLFTFTLFNTPLLVERRFIHPG